MSVPVTTMEKSTVEVPETVMEKFTVDKPVTVTRDVPETVRDVETRCAPATPCNLQVDLALLWALLYSAFSFVCGVNTTHSVDAQQGMFWIKS